MKIIDINKDYYDYLQKGFVIRIVLIEENKIES